MALTKLSLTNFRSYSQDSFELSPAVTLIVGPNASGKTNLLESLYVLALTKSFRAHDFDLINHGQDYFRIEAAVGDDELALAYQKDEGGRTKKLMLNGTKRSLTAHVGWLQTVLFEPGDLELITGPPDRRRRYLDQILCQTDHKYMTALVNYRRVLRQRNRLLSDFDAARIYDEIFTWDLQLAELAVMIVNQRQRLLQSINAAANQLYADIAGADIALEFNYQPGVHGDYAGGFMDALRGNLTRDLAAGFTTIGPHREDFKVRAGGNDITAVASRGEIRTAVLVMKLVELEYCRQISGQRPILLLDDVFSELDQSRRGYLVNRLGEYQTVITTTEADTLTAAGLTKDLNVIETASRV